MHNLVKNQNILKHLVYAMFMLCKNI